MSDSECKPDRAQPSSPMLEWTGERFLPWIKDASIAYEHLHRYAFAAGLVHGKRVLDLASGEGYGANLLARTAAQVVGIEIDDTVVKHATAKYGSANIQFLQGSISKIPINENQSFDAIVCFEAIEHVKEHDEMLAEVKRLLKPAGLFIVSTPNKAIYHDESHDENPFHVKELSIEEFEGLLTAHFKYVRYFGQRIHADSSIWPFRSKSSDTVRRFVIERRDSEFEFVDDDKRVPLYVIAIASDSEITVPHAGSVLVDESNELLKDKDRIIRELLETTDSQETALKWRDQQLRERNETIESLEKAIDWREAQLKDQDEVIKDREVQIKEREVQIKEREAQVQDREAQVKDREQVLEWTRDMLRDREATIASHEEALAWRAHQVEDLEKEKALLGSQLETTQRELRLTTEQLEAIHASRGWKFIVRLRHYRDMLRGLLGTSK